MNKPTKFKLVWTKEDKPIIELVEKTDQKTLAKWAIDCAERVMPFFEQNFPKDKRPRNAIKTLQDWIDTGVFKMSVIRKASLDAHSAARDVGKDNPARSAARTAGQAVATAHVPTHSLGAAKYALQAVYRATNPTDAEPSVAKERNWQYKHLCNLRKTK
ncbi:hypothetical protein A2Z22_01695 [Candidatus Woesebacteria bacterium RBG_16_34_12]|uniref:Imm-5-like domain-containing protein n=1 Tax=Candidatus Woesebacteria bacterium RBG_16_34_12 TaxID=1802480 RepID=A0A1F7XA82_9BACT|nr:MAG: hypothetical protein A2Z22_01695 [Candidatus Woesebacteria bacterium RBG_16_34_12]